MGLEDSSEEDEVEEKPLPAPASIPAPAPAASASSPYYGSTDVPLFVAESTSDSTQRPSPAATLGPVSTPATHPAGAAARPKRQSVVVSEQGGTRRLLSNKDIGSRVSVVKFGPGVLRFFGPHHRDGKHRCGVELDEPIGLNNGTVGVRIFFVLFFFSILHLYIYPSFPSAYFLSVLVSLPLSLSSTTKFSPDEVLNIYFLSQDHMYFKCKEKHGVLVDPRQVLLEKAQPQSLMLNPIYDDSPPPASAIAAALGYLAIESD